MASCVPCSSGSGSVLISKAIVSKSVFLSPIRIALNVDGTASSSFSRNSRLRIRVSMVDSSSNFAKRIERAWLISQQPTPIVCSSCNSKGHIECKWCAGTGFFIIGDNMLCEVPSRNTSCIICTGKGSTCCSNCQGTGFRAKWLEEPPTSE
ncbi:uncharacterized protein LOC130725876 [Lotus japonicus]|uniref:uncharacterized protein LOC130725876 n=1 Tax=Lotus japonicus TaxID=34305 RepID=UPI0025839A40|nr:uncharacterized protein LOC130725876 [Lotus japonicus]